jgi:lysophospholipid acyltransferase (LPLAT)-like uncharacterized protein
VTSRSDTLRFWLAGWAGWAVIRLLMATVRIEVVDGGDHQARLVQEGAPPILMSWHGHLLPLIYHHRNQGAVALASEHRDGEYITRVLARLGFGAARGSSTRGGSRGLRDLVKAARAGRILAITPDGPRGPRHRVKGGALVAARLTGRPILPMVAVASRGWNLCSWDRFLVPKPFSRVRIIYAPPFTVPRDADDGELERLAGVLEAEMARIEEVCRGDAGVEVGPAAPGRGGRMSTSGPNT